jgi:hypothetical protein
MTMNFSKHTSVIFVLVLSMLTPMAANIFSEKFITYIPSLVAATFLILASNKKTKLNIIFIVVLLTVFGYALFQLISGRGIGSGGILLIYFLVLFFTTHLKKSSASQIMGIMFLINIVFVVTLYLELLIVLTGQQDVLINLFNSDVVTKYKWYNHADFIKYLGFSNISGLNSIFLGSQSASMLAVLSTIYFLLENKFNKRYKLFVVALILIPFTSTMTANIVFTLLLLLLIYYFSNNFLYRRRYIVTIILIFTLTFFSQSMFDLIVYKLGSAENIAIYMKAFINPIAGFLDLNLNDTIFGTGIHVKDSYGNDFGFLELLKQAGIFLIALSLFIIVYIVSKVRFFTKKRCSFLEYDLWRNIALINALFLLGWLLSLVHYTMAVEPGVREIFAFNIAVCLVSIKRMRVIRFEEMPLQVK